MINMHKKRNLNKFIIAVLIITLTFSNWCIFGGWIISNATSEKLNLQTDETEQKNVKFNIGFEEESNIIYSKKANINDIVNLKATISVENEGYLKDTSITFSGDNNTKKNFEIIEIKQDNNIIKSSSTNEILLNQISENQTVSLGFAAILDTETKQNINKLSQNNIVKFASTYVNNQGKETKIEKSIMLHIDWECDNEITINSEISRYTEYKLEQETGVIITQTISINQNKPETIAYKSVIIELEQIKLDEKLADKIIIKSDNTDVAFETLENDKIKIKDENNEENGIIENTQTNRIYNVTYIFKDKDIKENLIIKGKIQAVAEIYASLEAKKAELDFSKEITQKLGNIVEITNEKIGDISKGKMYANYNQDIGSYETTYETNLNLNIAYKQEIKQIKISDIGTYFKNDKDTFNLQDETNSYTYYLSTKVNKSDFEKVLGTDGFIKFFDKNNNEICEINKNSNVDENGYYNIIFENQLSNISILTSEILEEGNINIINTKNIKSNLPFTKEEVKNFKTLEDEYKLELILENEETYTMQNTLTKNNLQESKTEASINFSTNKLSSISKNENVEIKIELKNNVETSDLYKNPEFEIKFPKEISQIDIKDTNILFDEELKIESVEHIKRDGSIVLKIKLKGTQSKFLLEEYINGTTIVINTDITVDVRASSKTENVVMNYYNENAITYNENEHGTSVSNIEFISPIGMIVGTKISNYNTNNEIIESIYQGEKTGKLEIYTEAQNAQTDILVVNNTGNDCDNLNILGRLAFKGNKDIVTGEDLGTTINTILTSPVTVDSNFKDIEIYYSDNEEANTDLEVKENNWTKDIASLENVKSFMIKINEKVMQSDIINIKYNFEIPANLEHNTYLYQDVAVFYNNNRDIAQVNEVSKADLMCLTTGRGPQMEITQTASIPNGEEVSEGQKIRYTIKIKNTGIDPIYEIQIKDFLPDNAIYTVYNRNGLSVGYDEKNPNAKILLWQYEELGVGEDLEVQFDVEVNKLPGIEEYYSQYDNLVEDAGKYYLKENDTLIEITEVPTIYMTNKVSVNAKDLGKEIYAQDYQNVVKSPEILVTEVSTNAEEVLMRENQDLTYTIKIKNNKQEDINNISVTKIIPEGLEFKEIYTIKYNPDYEEWEKEIIGTYNEETKVAVLNIGTISKNDDVQIKIETKTSKLAEDVYNKEFETITKITGNNIGNYIGNIMKNTIAKPKLETEYICTNNNKYINNGDIIEYSIKVTNVSNISANNVEINDVLPDGLELIKADYSIGEFNVTTSMNKNREIKVTGNLLPNETMILNIKAKAVSKSQNISVQNAATINSQELGSKQTEPVTHIIETSEEEGHISSKQEERKYTISGKVWYDKNRNGAKDTDENNLPQMEMMLVNADTGVVVQKLTNDTEGNYYINDLSKGNYLVILKYDSLKYQVTEYKKAEVADNLNSDVIAVDIQEDGVYYKGAISDTIRIVNNDITNIDIGLTDKLIFDLKLESEISKITIQNSKEIKEYNYENTSLAKIDIDPDLISSSVAYIEYKIKVTNEGNVPGFANSIIDNKMEDMTFNSELNPNWYIGQDGNLYSNELANQKINPGETKEIKLILIKQMTESNTGISLNTVEIHETYNEYGLEDIDSKENNKSDTEDDYSQTTALISVSLGGKIVYNISIIMVVIVAILAIIWYINRKKLFIIKNHKKKYK